MRSSDFWSTPPDCITPEFLALLPDTLNYGEPCYGRGSLVWHLDMKSIAAGKRLRCTHYSDLYPRDTDIARIDAREITLADLQADIDEWITNPPWHRDHLFPIIERLIQVKPAWMVLPSEFLHRRESAPFMARCSDVLPLGPINWLPLKNGNAYKCYAWYRFIRVETKTMLHHRRAERNGGNLQ